MARLGDQMNGCTDEVMRMSVDLSGVRSSHESLSLIIHGSPRSPILSDVASSPLSKEASLADHGQRLEQECARLREEVNAVKRSESDVVQECARLHEQLEAATSLSEREKEAIRSELNRSAEKVRTLIESEKRLKTECAKLSDEIRC
eukprot:1019754_1